MLFRFHFANEENLRREVVAVAVEKSAGRKSAVRISGIIALLRFQEIPVEDLVTQESELRAVAEEIF